MTPVNAWLGTSGVSVALTVLQQTTTPPETGPEELVDYWPVVVRVGWFFAGFLAVLVLGRVFVQPALARIIRRRNRNNPTLQEALMLYVRLFGVLVATLVGAAVAGYTGFFGDSALVISAFALAIGVAAQEVIGSLVSGMALVIDPEFNVGDYIEWDGGRGVVESITLRVTRVVTPGGELVTIPNTILTSHEITRPFGRDEYRVVQNVGVAYEDDVNEAMGHLRDTAAGLDEILADPPPTVYVDELGDDAVVLRIHYWIDDPDRSHVAAVRSTYARAIKTRLEDAGITISPAPEHDLQGQIEVDDARRGG